MALQIGCETRLVIVASVKYPSQLPLDVQCTDVEENHTLFQTLIKI